MRFMWASALLLGGLIGPAAASAQSGEDDEETNASAMEMAGEDMDDERARRHFEAGRNLYDAGAFDRAGQEFEEAYRLSNRPQLLYNVYVAYRDAGNVQKAAAALRQYLERVPDAPDRANLEARLESLEQQAAALAAAEQAQQQQQTEAQERDDSLPPPEPPPEEPSGPVLPWVVVGVGGAALVAGAVTGVMALGAVGDIEDECPGDACDPGFDLEGEREDARTLVRLTDILLIGGSVVTAAGLAWLLFGGGGDAEEAPVAAGCGPEGCMAEFRGTF